MAEHSLCPGISKSWNGYPSLQCHQDISKHHKICKIEAWTSSGGHVDILCSCFQFIFPQDHISNDHSSGHFLGLLFAMWRTHWIWAHCRCQQANTWAVDSLPPTDMSTVFVCLRLESWHSSFRNMIMHLFNNWSFHYLQLPYRSMRKCLMKSVMSGWYFL